MNPFCHLAACALLLLLAPSPAAARLLEGEAPRAGFSAQFVLSDQHAAEHRFAFPRKRVSVLVVADQKGAEQIAAWIAPLYARYAKRIDIAGVAALPGIPEAFHGLFRREFRKRLAYPVLLDWSGEVSRTFGAKAETANLYVIAGDGRIVESKSGPVTTSALRQVIAAVDQAMR